MALTLGKGTVSLPLIKLSWITLRAGSSSGPTLNKKLNASLMFRKEAYRSMQNIYIVACIPAVRDHDNLFLKTYATRGF